MASASGTFQITSMREDTYQELDGGGKLTRANGDQRFTGDIEGEGSVEWLMCYSAEGGARYVGLQRVSQSQPIVFDCWKWNRPLLYVLRQDRFRIFPVGIHEEKLDTLRIELFR